MLRPVCQSLLKPAKATILHQAGFQYNVMSDVMAQLERQCDRYCHVPRVPPQKVCVVGAGSDIGRVVSLMLKQHPIVKVLAMYDEHPSQGVLGVAADIAHIDTSADVEAFQGRNYQKDALHDSDVVVICGGCCVMPPCCNISDHELFFQNMQRVRTAVLACAQFCPYACIAVQSPPVDCNFALAVHTLQAAGEYDKRRVFGVNAISSMRANQLLCAMIGCDPVTARVPVVCGTGRCTRVPVFSAAKATNIPQTQVDCLTRLVREADDIICKVKSNNEQGHLSIGFATARFVIGIMQGLFKGSTLLDSALVEQANPEKCFKMQYCATPVNVGRGGIVDYLIPNLSPAEAKLLEDSKCDLEDLLNLGKCYATGGEYYVHECKLCPCVRLPDCPVCPDLKTKPCKDAQKN